MCGQCSPALLTYLSNSRSKRGATRVVRSKALMGRAAESVHCGRLVSWSKQGSASEVRKRSVLRSEAAGSSQRAISRDLPRLQLAISRDHREPRPLPRADPRHLVGVRVRVGVGVRVRDEVRV